MNSINFDNVYLLFLIIPLIALLTVPFFLSVRKSNRNGHNVASMVLHVVMAVLIAFSAAGASVVSVITKTEVYVVADVSYSANKNLDTVDNYITEIKKSLPASARLGVVCFGKDYELTTKLGGKTTSVKDAEINDTESNISEALTYAGGLFNDGVIKRIVLITDGRPSYGDSDDLVRTVSELQAEKVRVDAIYLDDNIGSDATEVQITSAEFTANTYLNHKEQVKVQINSSVSTNVSIDIFKDGIEFSHQDRKLSAGSNVFSYNLDTSEAGTFDYKLEIKPEADENDLNNTYSFTQTVTEDFNVLLVTASSEDAAFVRGLYDENVNVDSFIVENENSTVPYTVEAMCNYDEIVLSNVDLTVMTESVYQTFLTSLDTAVLKFGKSLITYGNLYIQSQPNKELALLDSMLPVGYGSADTDKKLYTIVIDVSYSMEMASRMILARQAAKKLVNSMNETDSVCIVEFSGQPQVIQPVTSLTNRDKIIEKIDELEMQHGTMIAPALKTAFNTIVNRSDFAEKQVYLITDGFSSGEDDMLNCEIVVDNMRANRIYTSVIAVGGQNYDYRPWMKNLAEGVGGGKYYLAENEISLNAVFIDGIKQDIIDPIVTDYCWIKTELTGDAVIAGDENLGLEALDFTDAFTAGFVMSSKKSNGVQNVLSVTRETRSQATGQLLYVDYPLYSYRNYGNGKVKTYTGTLNALEILYATDSENSAFNTGFFKNVVGTSVPSEKVDCPFTITTTSESKTARLRLEPAQLRASATATLSVMTPSGANVTDTLVRDATGYYYDLDMHDLGRYEVTFEYSYGGNVYSAVRWLNLSYEPEYDAFAVYDSAVLYKMLGGNGTVSQGSTPDLSNDAGEEEVYVLKLALPLLVVSVILYIIDIIIRKLRWNDIVSLFTSRGSGNNKAGGKK